MGENNPSRLALLGASVRAAAFSALPAGETADWQIVAADLFADTDLAARCPATTHHRLACRLRSLARIAKRRCLALYRRVRKLPRPSRSTCNAAPSLG